MFGRLDASNFNGSASIYENEFERILTKIVDCYSLMIEGGVILENDENKIRDVLVNDYVNNPKIKANLDLNYFVFSEISETKSTGRTDIRIHNPNSFINQNEDYYIIECKRLDNINTDGISGLNSKYIKDGIQRFISKKYSSYRRVNGMIGFIVADLKIDQNIKSLNALLANHFSFLQTTREITRETFIKNFEYHYSSVHLDEDQDQLKIYHLMFNLSQHIQN